MLAGSPDFPLGWDKYDHQTIRSPSEATALKTRHELQSSLPGLDFLKIETCRIWFARKKPFWSTCFQQTSAVKGLSAVEGLKISEVALETSEDWYSFYSNHGS